MSHPFELKLEDLSTLKTDFLEELTAEEAQTVHGGIKPVTTLRPDTVDRGEVGEEGGGGGDWWK